VSRQISLIVLSIGVITIAAGLSGCLLSNASDHQKVGRMSGKTIEQVLNEKADEWMAVPGVAGVAIGQFKGKPCIRIFTSAKPQQLRAKLPSTVEGYPVIVEQTGPIRALGHED
jgi:hypothetical protein